MANLSIRQRIAILVAGPALLAIVATLPMFGGDFELQLGTLVVIYALAVVGLDVVAGRGGLLHSGFGIVFGTGAYTVIVISTYWSKPTIVAVALGSLLAALISAALGILLARSSAFMFAVLTLAASTAAASVVSNVTWLGGNSGLAAASRDLFGLGEIRPLALYCLLCVVTLAIASLYLRFRFSATGRAIEALRLVPNVAQACGINTARLRIEISVLAGTIGGLGGAFYAVQQEYVSADLLGAITSVNLLATGIIGGFTVAFGGIPGAFVTIGLPQLFQQLVSYQIILVGAVVGIVALWFRRGIAGSLQDLWWDAVKPLFSNTTQSETADHRSSIADRPRRDRDALVLQVVDATVNFGGVTALNKVSMDLHAGRLHALIGPNGAGKSTLVGFIAGSVLGSRSGAARLRGSDIGGLRPDQRAAAGITRTFQLVSLCETLTGIENVMLGGHIESRASFVRDFLALNSREQEAAHAQRAASILDMLGAAHVAHIKPGEMTSGQQRLVEIARCLMTDADVILLDEPAAGLSTAERGQLAKVIRGLAAGGHTVLLIEHDMEFVMSVAERITVLVNGAVLADGKPELVRSDPRVIGAYWGRPAAA